MSTNLRDKINKIKGSKKSNWRENAAYRQDSKWREYSLQIARRILAVIDENEGLNQSKLAEILNVTPQQISKIVKGKENLTLDTIYKLSKALDFELIIFPDYKYSKPLMGIPFKLDQAKIVPMHRFVAFDTEKTPYSVSTAK